ncbi:solute:sodium symporter family transporter [Bacillus sp. T33-2]|uniref:solute:sodium symporter family transporter n=1 Tax=Bacillus sp. T33-2 TaxID=2054168 RepID=UPI000C779315|nr:solute:sodium symporter family transporter [Bacillus sp. T33-2]PLR95861.1 solute:sodium symporter family transporter [Bacillus sp. T33-2]
MVITVLSFLLLNIAIAFYSWKKAKEVNLDSSEGYFLGGRSLTAVYIGSSLLLTNLSTEQMVGLNGQSYSGSMTAMAWEVSAPIALIMFAFIFLPRYLKLGITTIPKFLEDRYDLNTRLIVSVLLMAGYTVSFLPTVLYSGALVLDKIFNISEILGWNEFGTVFVISAFIGITGICYIYFGGLKAISSADTLYGVGLIVGGFAILIFGLHAVGDGSISEGLHKLTTNYTEKLNSLDSSNSAQVPWPTILTGLLVNNLFYWAVNQAIVQRALGAQNLAEGQKGVLLAALFKTLGAFYLVVPGILAFHLYGDSINNPDNAYPVLVADLLPTALAGVFAAILFGAILSSFNGALNSTMTLFTMDIYKQFINPKASDERLVKVGQRFILVLGLISVCIAPVILLAPSGLYTYLQETFGFLNVPILAAVTVGFFSKRVPAIAPKIGIVAHIILYGLSKFIVGEIHFLYILAVLFPVNVAIMLIVGKIAPREEEFKLEASNKVETSSWKYAKPASAVILLIMIGIYILFSPWGIAT